MPDSPVEAVPSPSRTGRNLAIVVGVLVLLGGAGIYFATRPTSLGGAAPGGSEAAFTFPLETFVVNLNGSGRSYLRVGIALGLSRAPARKEEFPVAVVRDTIVSILSAAKPDDLAQAEGKNKLKGAILQALKERLPQIGVEDVYFTEFLVQM